jgi:hypothetical protein
MNFVLPTRRSPPSAAPSFIPRITPPGPIKALKNSSKQNSSAPPHATVVAIISESGDIIDLKVEQALGAAIGESILDSVSNYRFQPGALSGNPAAMLVRVDVAIKIF